MKIFLSVFLVFSLNISWCYILDKYHGVVYYFNDDFIWSENYAREHKVKQLKEYETYKGEQFLRATIKYNKKGYRTECTYYSRDGKITREYWYEYYKSELKQLKRQWVKYEYDEERSSSSDEDEPMKFKNLQFFKRKDGIIDSIKYVDESDKEVVKIFNYDVANHLTKYSVVYCQGRKISDETTFEYDDAGRLIYEDLGSYDLTFSWDERDRLQRAVLSTIWGSRTVSDTLFCNYSNDTTYMTVKQGGAEMFTRGFIYVKDESGLILSAGDPYSEFRHFRYKYY